MENTAPDRKESDEICSIRFGVTAPSSVDKIELAFQFFPLKKGQYNPETNLTYFFYLHRPIVQMSVY